MEWDEEEIVRVGVKRRVRWLGRCQARVVDLVGVWGLRVED